MYTTFVTSNDNEPDGIIGRMVNLSRAKTADLISVAGPLGIEVLGLLCRSSFERVQCARHAMSSGVEELSDVLIIAGTTRPAALSCELEHTLNLL